MPGGIHFIYLYDFEHVVVFDIWKYSSTDGSIDDSLLDYRTIQHERRLSYYSNQFSDEHNNSQTDHYKEVLVFMRCIMCSGHMRLDF